MENIIKKATEFLTSVSGVESVCLTSDGSVFMLENHKFADAHSQKLDDHKIVILSVNKTIPEQMKTKVFKGSKWSFKTIEKQSEPVKKTVAKKKPKK